MKALIAILGRWIDAAWRNRWTFLVPVATLVLPATLYALSLPDVYEAKAIVQVQPLAPADVSSRIPREVTNQAAQVMPTVRDRIFTRDNLAAVVPILAPEVTEPVDPLFLEEMAKSFAWEQTASTLFQVTNKNPDPSRAARAVNTLLETFLEGEREERQRRAERSRTFHETELVAAREEHREKLDALDTLRQTHADTLPERKDAITGELTRLQLQIATQMGMESAARQRVQLLDDQLVMLHSTLLAGGAVRTSAIEESLQYQLAEESRALNALEQELASALATKTDRHPDVTRLRSAVAVHRQAVTYTTAELGRVRTEAQQARTESMETRLARRRKSLQEQRTSAAQTAERTAGVVTSLGDRVSELQRHMAGIPTTQALLDPVLRDLEQAGKRLEAREAAAGSAREQADYYRTGELTDVTGFRVSAWAVVPVKIAGPGRTRYLLTAVLLGLLIGYGLMLLRHRHEGGAVMSSEDVSGLFPAAVIVHVPLLGAGRRSPWPRRLAEVGMTAYVGILLAATVYFLAAHKGWIAKPGWMIEMFGGSA